MKKLLCIALCASCFLASYEKELDFEYKSVAPVYVIEGRVTNETTEVLITQTRNVDNPEPTEGIAGATVTITSGGTTETLLHQTDGYYRPASGMRGEAGKDYTLTVRIGEDEFISSSRMSGASSIDSLYFYWMEAMGNRYLFLRFRFADLPGEENYYCCRVRRNGELYAWDVTKDQGADGETMEENIMCMSESAAEENKREDWNEILYEGDVIELELQTIDRRAYDYLQSLDLSESTSANPVYNFSSPCMGYFSAYSAVRKTVVFRYQDVATDE